VSVELPLWPRCRMRVLALETAGPETLIRTRARVVVTSDPAVGCKVERIMSGSYDPDRPRSRPFANKRLEDAIWAPSPADILVAASAETPKLIPLRYTRRLPWIQVLTAWWRIMPRAPSGLLGLCWHRGRDPTRHFDDQRRGSPEPEVSLLASMLVVLLHVAPPAELVAHTGDQH
jgi:hypothetical protein